MAEGKEAEQVSTSDSDQADFIEPEIPGEIQNSMLVTTDSYEHIDYQDLESPVYDSHPSGIIHAIVRSGSVEETGDTNEVQVQENCEESNEDASSNEVIQLQYTINVFGSVFVLIQSHRATYFVIKCFQ